MANKALNQVSQVQSTELANVKTFLAVMNNGEIKQMSKEDMSAVVGELLGIEDYNIKWNFVFSLNKGPVGLGALGGLAVLNTDSIQEQCAALLSMYGGVVTFLYNNQNFISGNRDTEISNKIILFFDNSQWFVKSTYVAAIKLYVQIVAGKGS